DAADAMKRGRLTFTLHGAKLRGRWHLVRTKGTGKQESWLLFKGKDDAASETIDVITEHPESVLSGRTIDEVSAAPTRTWQSNRIAAEPVRLPSEVRPGADLLGLVARLPLGFPLTNLDKVLYPEQGLTKGELIAYLAVVAEWMLPHVADR